MRKSLKYSDCLNDSGVQNDGRIPYIKESLELRIQGLTVDAEELKSGDCNLLLFKNVHAANRWRVENDEGTGRCDERPQ